MTLESLILRAHDALDRDYAVIEPDEEKTISFTGMQIASYHTLISLLLSVEYCIIYSCICISSSTTVRNTRTAPIPSLNLGGSHAFLWNPG